MLREPSNEQPDYKFAGLKERHEDIQRKEKENHASHRPKPFQYENPHHGLREKSQRKLRLGSISIFESRLPWPVTL